MKYAYTFEVSHDPAREFTDAGANFYLIAHGSPVTLAQTEEEFARMRENLGREGILLEEIGRVPYHEPEAVP